MCRIESTRQIYAQFSALPLDYPIKYVQFAQLKNRPQNKNPNVYL